MESRANRWILMVFREKIEEVLNPTDILPYLPEWPQGEKEAILEKPDREGKLERMFEYIMKESTDFGKQPFKEFIQSLTQADYNPLVSLLVDGEGYYEYETLKKLHNVTCPEIQKKIVVDRQLLNKLMGLKVITEGDKEEIARNVREGRHTDAVFTLIRCLPRRHEKWPELWIRALRETGNENVIKVLFGDAEFTDEERIREKLEDQQPDCLGASNDNQMDVDLPEQDGAMDVDPSSQDSASQETEVKTPYQGAEGGAVAGRGDGDGTEGDSSEPTRLVLRSYQKELAAPGIDGRNAIVCSPTGSGKTNVGVAIAEDHLLKKPRDGNELVIFVVDTVHLMEQQKTVFEKNLPKDYPITGLCGGTAEDNLCLSQIMKEKRVIVLTAQILLNALQSDSEHNDDVFTIHDISLLILDECQNTSKKHPYNQIMRFYRREKLKPREERTAPLPQIIGLTASLGVGKAGNVEAAIKHIEKMCANLDATPYVVEKNKDELRQYVPTPEMEMEKVPRRKKDPCHQVIKAHMEEIHSRMRDHPNVEDPNEKAKKNIAKELAEIPGDPASEVYTAWIANMDMRVPLVKDGGLRMPFMTYVEYLKIYHDALNINEQVRTKDALDDMSNRVKAKEQHSGDDVVQMWLQEQFKLILRKLQPLADDPDLENPLLNLLRTRIQEYTVDSTSCGIVFVQTRAAVYWLQRWMQEDRELKALNPGIITGTTEMTQNKQVEVVDDFRKGKHKCLIATSVAERGLDIPQCNWVIKYLHTTNEIALVQSKGRARKLESKYSVVALDTSGKVEKEETNILREAMMNRAVSEVSHMDKTNLLQRLERIQREEMKRYDMEQNELLSRPLVTDDYNILCRKCDALVTNSADLRIHNKSHHTSIRQGLEDSYVAIPLPEPEDIPQEYFATQSVHCKKCKYKWGLFAKVLGLDMPLFTPKGLKFVHIKTDRRLTYRKWKQFPFTIPQYLDE